jgi:hypothetical protein
MATTIEPAQPADSRKGGRAPWELLYHGEDCDPLTVAPWPDAPAEWSALHRALERGDVSFHNVATAWFHANWGPDPCPQCRCVGKVRVAPASTNAPPLEDCPACNGRGYTGTAEAIQHWKDLFPALLDTFGRQRGGVVTCYFCSNIRVAAALTDIYTATGVGDAPVPSLHAHCAQRVLEHERERARAELRFRARRRRLRELNADDPWRRVGPGPRLVHWLRRIFGQKAVNTAIHVEPTFGDPDSPRAKELLFRCQRVHYHAIEWLKPKPRKICTRMTFNVIANLLGTLDERVGRGEPAGEFDNQHRDQEVLEKEILRTEQYFHGSAQRTARLAYLRGMLLGLLGTAGVVLPLYFVQPIPDELSLMFLAGALGALVSVLQRLSGGHLTVNHEDGKWTLHLLGFIRPLLGGLFGLAIYAFLEGGVLVGLDIPTTAEGVDETFFLAAIGFLAGFSERFAKDVLDPAKVVPGSPTRTPGAVPGAPQGGPAA